MRTRHLGGRFSQKGSEVDDGFGLCRQLCEASFATITIMLKQCNFHPLVDVKEMVRVQAKWGFCIEYEGLVKCTVICAEGSGWHEVVNCSSGIYPNVLAFQINFCGWSHFVLIDIFVVMSFSHQLHKNKGTAVDAGVAARKLSSA